MKFTPAQYASALYEAVRQTSDADHDLVLDNFVRILAQNGDLEKYEKIEGEYKMIEMREKGFTQAEVTLAREVEIDSFVMDKLNKMINAGAKTNSNRSEKGPPSTASTEIPLRIEINKKIDESLIGGVVIRFDDVLIDASVKGELNKLNQQLKS